MAAAPGQFIAFQFWDMSFFKTIFLLEIKIKQECIAVECAPFAAVAAGGRRECIPACIGQREGVYPSMHRGGGVCPGGGVFAWGMCLLTGGVCQEVSAPPVNVGVHTPLPWTE